MKLKTLFITLTLVFIAFVQSVDFQEEDGVLVLTDENFNSAMEHYEHILVEFYAPWCGHCKKLAPEYVAAAEILKKANSPLRLAKVDGTVQKEISKTHGIRGYPTLKFFVSGKPVMYDGGRTAIEIVAWLKKKTGPGSEALSTVEEVEAFHNNQEVAVLYFGDKESDIEVFKQVARGIYDIPFGHVSIPEVFAHYNVQPGTVVLFKKFDEKRADLTSPITVEELTQFINRSSVPLVMKFDNKCSQLIFGKKNPGLFLYRDKNSENSAELENLIRSISTKLNGKLKVVVSDVREGEEARLADYIGIKSPELPTVRIFDTRGDLKKYKMEGEINEENILQFVEDWENKKLKPNLKSEEVPASQNGDVYVLVGNSFEEVVLKSDKNVLVEFYAPWCGHCKQLTPIYEEIARKYKGNDNIIIAKIDATANEVESVSIKGFPTLKFYKAGRKDAPMNYSEARTVEGFTKFLNEQLGIKEEAVELSVDAPEQGKKDDL